MSFIVDISNRQRRLKLNRPGIRGLAVMVLKELDLSRGEVGFVFVNDRRIRELNRTYLRRDYPTDVIAFPQNEGEDKNLHDWFLGDVVISTQRVLDQAERFGQSGEDELGLCLIHGILHLFGYRDSPENDLRTMRKMEQCLFRKWKRSSKWSLIKS